MTRAPIEARYAAAEHRRGEVALLETGAPVVALVKLTALDRLESRRARDEVVEAGTRGRYVRPWLDDGDTVDWHVLEFYIGGSREPLLAPAHLSHFRPT